MVKQCKKSSHYAVDKFYEYVILTFVSYKRKYEHEVLVDRLVQLAQEKSVVYLFNFS